MRSTPRPARFTRPIACSTSARRGLRRAGGWRGTFRAVTPPVNPPGARNLRPAVVEGQVKRLVQEGVPVNQRVENRFPGDPQGDVRTLRLLEARDVGGAHPQVGVQQPLHLIEHFEQRPLHVPADVVPGAGVVLVGVVEAVVGLGHALVVSDHESGAVLVVRLASGFECGVGLPAFREREGLEAVRGGVAESVFQRGCEESRPDFVGAGLEGAERGVGGEGEDIRACARTLCWRPRTQIADCCSLAS